MRRKIWLFLAVLSMVMLGSEMPIKAQEVSETECSGYGVVLEAEPPQTYDVVTYGEMDLTPDAVYNRMIAMKDAYPEGMPWTNDNFYAWNGGYYYGGYGCAGFAFILSDAAFGNLPSRFLEENDFDSIRVGDILRINSDTHSVIVLEVHDDYVVIAEGNYNRSIHWGRTLTRSSLESGTLTYIMTRYPSEYESILVESIYIIGNATLNAGDVMQLVTTVYPSNATNTSVSWISTNESVATVDANGFVTAVGPGTANIIVTAQDGSGICASCVVTVTQPVTGITLNQTVLELVLAETYTLRATVFPDNATNKAVLWTSSDESVVKINQNGVISVVGVGTATVTATAKDGSGVSSSCAVTTSKEDGNPFYDVFSTKWYYPYVKSAYDAGLMGGTGSNAATGTIVFLPEKYMERSQFVQVLYSAEGKPDVTYATRFTDIPEGKWYTDAVLWAAENGITGGNPDGSFGRFENITREQLALMLMKYADLKGYNLSGEAELNGYADAEKVSSWALPAMKWAVHNGIISGTADGRLNPQGATTRAEGATMLVAFYEKFQ